MTAHRPLSGQAAGLALALACLFILGVMPVISNGRPAGFGALSFAFWLSAWEVAFAAPLLIAEARSANKGLFGAGLDAGLRRRAVVAGLFTGLIFALSTYLYVLSVEKAGAVSAAIAIQAYPLFAIMWESLFLGRRKSGLELALTGGLIAALVYLGTAGTGRIEVVSRWFLLALAVPFLWSIAHVLIREELGRTPITPAQITFFRVAISAAALGAVLAFADPAALIEPLRRVDFQLFALAMGLVYYLELLAWFNAVRFIDVSLASSITTPWPALTMAVSSLFLGEAVHAYQLIAFAVVAACIWGLIRASLKKPAAG